jgi:hypothetical protein
MGIGGTTAKGGLTCDYGYTSRLGREFERRSVPPTKDRYFLFPFGYLLGALRACRKIE